MQKENFAYVLRYIFLPVLPIKISQNEMLSAELLVAF